MKISVLIPTHNRPDLFKRCIDSVIGAWEHHRVDLEIIVNNDSHDITEVHKELTTYNYNRSDNLGDIYLGLFARATKEYIYFLEDDDIMNKHFFQVLDWYQEDIFYFNYVPYEWQPHFLKFFDYTKGEYVNKDEFLSEYDPTNFQFGQICFKKKCIDLLDFPDDNNLHNDFRIFQLLKGSFRTINNFMYKQTVDGRDNISFRMYNKDSRWTS